MIRAMSGYDNDYRLRPSDAVAGALPTARTRH